MALALTSPAMICNAALKRIGSLYRIGNLYDGSVGADAALAIYAQARDEKLASYPWAFARRTAALANPLKSAPIGGYYPTQLWDPTKNPPIGWNYEYGYPADCLKIRSLACQFTTGTIVPNFAPEPVEFSEANDDYLAPPQKVILTNLFGAIVIYTGQVTDPALWVVGFTEVLIADLGKQLSPALAKLSQEGAAGVKTMAGEEMVQEAEAEARVG